MKKLVLLLLVWTSTAFADKSFTGDKNAAWDCGKDPEVSITTSNATFTLTGVCTSIATTGNNIKLKIERVNDLVINGNGNTALIGTLGELTINGNKNTVKYSKAKSGRKASVQNNGNGNAVAKDKRAGK